MKNKGLNLIIIVIICVVLMSSGCELLNKDKSSNKKTITTMTEDQYAEFLKPTPNEDELNYFDCIICEGDTCKVVTKRIETTDESYDVVGVIDNNMNWVIDLSKDSPIYSDGELPDNAFKTVSHLGNDIFIKYVYLGNLGNRPEYKGGIWTVKENRYEDLGSCRFIETEFKNGYIVGIVEKKAALIDESGRVYKSDIECENASIGQFSENLFFAYDGFYDSSFKKVIDLSEYAGKISNNPEFHNGECEIVMYNPNGVEFYAVID